MKMTNSLILAITAGVLILFTTVTFARPLVYDIIFKNEKIRVAARISELNNTLVLILPNTLTERTQRRVCFMFMVQLDNRVKVYYLNKAGNVRPCSRFSI